MGLPSTWTEDQISLPGGLLSIIRPSMSNKPEMGFIQQMRTRLHHALVPLLPKKLRAAVKSRRSLGYWPNLYFPKRFNEKLLLRNLYGSDSRWVETSDKVRVRDYVEKKIGDQFLTRAYGVFDSAADIDFDHVPDSFVLKANHGSGWNCIVPDKASADLEGIRKKASNWLSSRYAASDGEWWYNQIQPKVLIEELLRDERGSVPADFKFFVFRGKVAMIQVDLDRFTKHARNLYDVDWNRLPFSYHYETGDDIPKPALLREMIDVASRLGADFDFVRVDLYAVGNRVVFGEMTHCPEGGKRGFSDRYYDEWLGSLMRED